MKLYVKNEPEQLRCPVSRGLLVHSSKRMIQRETPQLLSDDVQILPHFPAIIMVKPLLFDETPQHLPTPAEKPSNTVKEVADIEAPKQKRPLERRGKRKMQNEPLAVTPQQQTPPDDIEELSPSVTVKEMSQEREDLAVVAPPFAKKFAWMETSNTQVAKMESELHTLPATPIEEFKEEWQRNFGPAECEIVVEILPLHPSMTVINLDEEREMERPPARRKRNPIIDDRLEVTPPSIVKIAWMETSNMQVTQRKPEAEVTKVERITKVDSPQPATIKHERKKTCKVQVTQRPKPSGQMYSPQAEGQSVHMEKKLRESTVDIKVGQKPSLLDKGMHTFAKWRDLRKRERKEMKARKLQEYQFKFALYERYVNDPQMKHLICNKHNRFN